MSWQKTDALPGVEVSGDYSMFPTYRWFRWLVCWFWRDQVILSVSPEVARMGYFIGFTDFNGRSKRAKKVCHALTFSMMVGNEDVIFFIKLYAPWAGDPPLPTLVSRHRLPPWWRRLLTHVASFVHSLPCRLLRLLKRLVRRGE
jgi:hypothetical protein